MKKILFFLLATLFSCTDKTLAQIKLDATQTETMLQEDKSVQLIDLRTTNELAETGKIEGATTINFNSPEFQEQIAKLDKEKPVLVYCAAGGRSGKAAAQLTKLGFTKVFNYAGGMSDWKAKGKKTVF
jgi:rhodanese-related sulfurtransferase